MSNESPLIEDILEEARKQTVLTVIRENIVMIADLRFADLRSEIVETLNAILDETRLRGLVTEVIRCTSLNEFRAKLN